MLAVVHPNSTHPITAISTVNPPDDNLAAALARHNIELPQPQIARLDQYCRLLWDWNSKINLTRHTDFEKFVSRDLVDSQAFARFLSPGETVLDVGTGGGVPGVVLAILRDDLQISLCESVGKKARTVADIVEKLGLSVPVHHARAEDLLVDRRFNTLGDPCRGPAEEVVGMVQAALGRIGPDAGLERPQLGRRTGRGAALRPDARFGPAEAGILPACRARNRKACCCKSARWRIQ